MFIVFFWFSKRQHRGSNSDLKFLILEREIRETVVYEYLPNKIVVIFQNEVRRLSHNVLHLTFLPSIFGKVRFFHHPQYLHLLKEIVIQSISEYQTVSLCNKNIIKFLSGPLTIKFWIFFSTLFTQSILHI